MERIESRSASGRRSGPEATKISRRPVTYLWTNGDADRTSRPTSRALAATSAWMAAPSTVRLLERWALAVVVDMNSGWPISPLVGSPRVQP